MAEQKIKIVDLSSGVFSAASRFLAVEDGDNVMLEGSDMANKICNSFAYTQNLDTTAKVPVAAVNEIQPYRGKVLKGTLEAGQTSLVFNDSYITAGRMFGIYSDVQPLTALAVSGSLTLTFTAQAEDLEVKVVVMKGTGGTAPLFRVDNGVI